MIHHFIHAAVHHPGALHKALHIPLGHKIPVSLLRKAARHRGKLGHQAHLALQLRHIVKR